MILTDNETKVDLLNSESIAHTIVKVIRERPEHPVTIGVHGDWGAGKSSVLEMIEVRLKKDDLKDKVVCIKFNGWRFQGFEDAKIALIENIVTELIEQKPLLTKASEEVIDIFQRIDWLKVAKKSVGLGITAFTGIPTGAVVETFLTGLQNLTNNPSGVVNKERADDLFQQASSLLKPKDPSKNVPKEISEFRKSFDKLLKAAGVEQLIVLVDDLDRCLPDTAIETLEAIRLFIFTQKTAFVIAADEGMIEYAVRRHFPDLPDTLMHQSYTRNYLEKLIQIPFKIPILGEAETKIYVTLLLVGSEIGEGEDFDKLIGVARERLKKPWESLPLDAETIRNTLGDRAKDVQNTVLLSDQIGPILANGAKGNPRVIKRFLNTLLLRQLTAEARGFGSSINLPALAKLMIAERFIPRLFEQIATSAATALNGICEELKYLEIEVADKKEEKESDNLNVNGKEKALKEKTKAKRQEINNKSESPLFLEWANSENIKDWAKIKPSLADLDLRPYIFVAKDKKDFFGTSTSLGHLTFLIEKLFGKKFSVQTLESEIKDIPASDTIRIFDEMRSRIIGSTDFTKEPDGIPGLMLVVKSHPDLQGRLMDFLEILPTASLGAWVVKGWEGILTSGAEKKRFDKLIDNWSTNGNPFLMAAASSVKKIR